MSQVSNLTPPTRGVAPPTTAEIGPAFVRLALGVAQRIPNLLQTYLGPPEWLDAVLAEPASLEVLRQHAVAVATAAQQSDLPRNRRERILRRVRALLWLIRAAEGEQIIFSEQVRMLLDLQPEGVDEPFFQAAHDALADALPGSEPLAERWADWQATYTLPAAAARPLLASALETLRQRWGAGTPLGAGEIDIVETGGDGPPAYRAGELRLPQEATLRADRIFHLAARWGYGGAHSVHTAATRRYAAGELESAVLLNLGPDTVLSEGLSRALLPDLDLYATAIPALLRRAGLPAPEPDRLQAIHLAEDALGWGLANAALLLHGEGLRPRAVRRHLLANALLPPDAANSRLEELADPVRAAHVFAPLLGGPLIRAWLDRGDHPVDTLLADPPVPSTLVFDLRFAD